MPKLAREESGAQLLARLGSRPGLSCIDPCIFGQHRPSSSSSSSSSLRSTPSQRKFPAAAVAGHLVEIFGPEGAGKTELSLHYLARVCLPQEWNGTRIGGVGAKAIIVDTELKFSVLRLAVIMEKLILALQLSQDVSDGDDTKRPNTQTPSDVKSASSLSAIGSCGRGTCANTRDIKPESIHSNAGKAQENFDACSKDKQEDKTLPLCSASLKTNTTSSIESFNLNAGTCSGNVSLENQMENPSYEVKREAVDDVEGDKTSGEGMSGSSSLTPEDVESIVQEALGRVQVVKPNDSQQLYMTLLYLESTLTSDLNMSFLLLDSVSAFFWEDCLAENAAFQAQKRSSTKLKTSVGGRIGAPVVVAGGMAQVAGVVSRFVSELGITVVMTKSPLVNWRGSSRSGRKRKWRADREEVDSIGGGCDNRDKTLREEALDDDHVEFLGKAWANLNATRISLSLSEDWTGKFRNIGSSSLRKVTTASCSLWPKKRQFMFVDDFLQFL